MKQPYLIQRGKAQRYPNPTKPMHISNTIDLDYMGNAEYEFGAMPKSLRDMAKKSCVDNGALVIRELPITDREGRPLLAIGITAEEVDTYFNAIKPVVCDKARTKGHNGFEDMVLPLSQLSSWHPLKRTPPAGFKRGEKKEEWLARQLQDMTRFWWDIDNNVMMTFEPELMAKLPSALMESWKSMDPAPTLPEMPEEETIGMKM